MNYLFVSLLCLFHWVSQFTIWIDRSWRESIGFFSIHCSIVSLFYHSICLVVSLSFSWSIMNKSIDRLIEWFVSELRDSFCLSFDLLFLMIWVLSIVVMLLVRMSILSNVLFLFECVHSYSLPSEMISLFSNEETCDDLSIGMNSNDWVSFFCWLIQWIYWIVFIQFSCLESYW